MALFQRKKPQINQVAPLYTQGLNRQVLIVGLGNPGAKYEMTRHNLGFYCLDNFTAKQDFSAWQEQIKLKCLLSRQTIGDSTVYAIKPTTYMNLSGEAVALTANYFKLKPDQILVIHDELDIPWGQIRTRTGGRSAGHNGVESIINRLGTEFGRLRVGIGPKSPPEIEAADYVLARLTAAEQAQLPELLRETAAVLSEFVFGHGPLPTETRNFLI